MHRPMYLTNIDNGEMHHSPFVIALTLLFGTPEEPSLGWAFNRLYDNDI